MIKERNEFRCFVELFSDFDGRDEELVVQVRRVVSLQFRMKGYKGWKFQRGTRLKIILLNG